MELIAQLNAALAGRYDVEREIGAGGMATVYLARDLRHDRPVALKVLKPELGAVLGADRFLAEIKVTANLQHPNILPLFDSGAAGGLLFYVMPFVEGETLRARLDREKQLPVGDAQRIATAVASGLAYAHERGVIHRDLKPENILMQSGQPVIADFGIALAVRNAGGQRVTQTGISLGTPQYMSPEQAAGDRAVDGRSDLYSLGAVTYEMLGGEPPHSGTSAQAIIAKLMTAEPQPLRSLRAAVPVNVADAVEKALAKLPADRFSGAQEFAAALANPSYRSMHSPGRAGLPQARDWRARMRDPWLLALAVIAIGAIGLLGVLGRRAAMHADAFPLRFELSTGAILPLGPAALSPDGHTIVFSGRSATERNPGLYLHRLDQLGSRLIAGTDYPQAPVFSPDGKWIAYIANRRKIVKVPIDGGAAVPLGDVADDGGLDWTTRGDIVAGSGVSEGRQGLLRGSSAGGALQPFTRVDSARRELSHQFPRALDDGRTVLFTIWTGDVERSEIAATDIDDGKVVPLGVMGVKALGVVDGRLVYVRPDGTAMAVPFDVQKRRTSGIAVPVLDSLQIPAAGAGDATAFLTHAGGLVFAAGAADRRLVWVDGTGAVRPALGDARDIRYVRLSPDGRKVALGINTGPKADLWILDLATGTLSPLTTTGTSRNASWSPDGRRVLFVSTHDGRTGFWWQAADGSGPAVKAGTAPHNPWWTDLSSDGHSTVYNSIYDGSWNVESFSLDSAHTQRELATLPGASEVMARFSPDGHFIAYGSDESGRREVYVRPFPEAGSRVQISAAGGNRPIWAPDGRQLYFWEGSTLVSATLARDPALRVVSRAALFSGHYEADYDVARDGSRFLMIESAASALRLVVEPNWRTELDQRMEAGRAK